MKLIIDTDPGVDDAMAITCDAVGVLVPLTLPEARDPLVSPISQ